MSAPKKYPPTPIVPASELVFPQKYARKTELALKMMAMGESAENALKLTNLRDTISGEAVRKLEQKYRRWTLNSPTMAHLAHSQVRRILKGTPRQIEKEVVLKNGQATEITEQIVPSDTNILSAAMMVYDRYEPVRGGPGEDQRIQQYIDLSEYTVQVAIDERGAPLLPQTKG